MIKYLHSQQECFVRSSIIRQNRSDRINDTSKISSFRVVVTLSLSKISKELD